MTKQYKTHPEDELWRAQQLLIVLDVAIEQIAHEYSEHIGSLRTLIEEINNHLNRLGGRNGY